MNIKHRIRLRRIEWNKVKTEIVFECLLLDVCFYSMLNVGRSSFKTTLEGINANCMRQDYSVDLSGKPDLAAAQRS